MSTYHDSPCASSCAHFPCFLEEISGQGDAPGPAMEALLKQTFGAPRQKALQQDCPRYHGRPSGLTSVGELRIGLACLISDSRGYCYEGFKR